MFVRASCSYLDALLVIDSSDDPDTDLWNLGEFRLINANIPESLDHPFPHADSRVLFMEREHIIMNNNI